MNDALHLEDAQAEALMGQIVDEFLERKDRGERPDVEDYARRYPELAGVLRQMLPALGLMQWSAGDASLHGGERASCVFPLPSEGRGQVEGSLESSEAITPEGPLGDY